MKQTSTSNINLAFNPLLLRIMVFAWYYVAYFLILFFFAAKIWRNDNRHCIKRHKDPRTASWSYRCCQKHHNIYSSDCCCWVWRFFSICFLLFDLLSFFMRLLDNLYLIFLLYWSLDWWFDIISGCLIVIEWLGCISDRIRKWIFFVILAY